MDTLNWYIREGSVRGREHQAAGQNNQDACFWRTANAVTTVVVCDGCGSGRHSEVGALLGARLVTEAILRNQPGGKNHQEILENARMQILHQLDLWTRSMEGDHRQTVHDYFLFTIVGVLITENLSTVFSIGDGLAAINGESIPIGSFPENQPPYLAYALCQPMAGDSAFDTSFQIHGSVPNRAVDSILIGTDGAMEFSRIQDRNLPGKNEKVGPLSQFWSQDRYVVNRDAIRRRLTLINREGIRLDRVTGRMVRENGLLRDDTTLVVIRRR